MSRIYVLNKIIDWLMVLPQLQNALLILEHDYHGKSWLNSHASDSEVMALSIYIILQQ